MAVAAHSHKTAVVIETGLMITSISAAGLAYGCLPGNPGDSAAVRIVHFIMILRVLVAPLLGAAVPDASLVICGPDIVTIGDAWEKTRLAEREADHLLKAGSLPTLPQKLASISAHLRFMQSGAVMLFGKRRAQLDKGVSSALTLGGQMTASVLNNRTADLAETWNEMKAAIRFVGAQFPEEALIPSASFAHLLPPAQPVLHIQLEPLPPFPPNQPLSVVFGLVHLKDVSPAGPEEIIATHDAKLHGLVCDRTLTDYHHVHPEPTGRPGEWRFTFTPKLKEHYRLWINAVPKATGREEFIMNNISPSVDLPQVPPSACQLALSAQTESLLGEIRLATGARFQAKTSASATLHLVDREGKRMTNLESHMGAFAHIVGISEDYFTILHVHPDAGSPDVGKSGADIGFRLNPPRSGFYRLFVQVKRAGKIHTLAFGIQVD